MVMLLLLAAAPARGAELQVAVGAQGEDTTWRDDAAAYSSLQVGLRFKDLVSVDLLGRLGYGTVDERVLSYFCVGGELWGRLGPTRPRLRLGIVHQHEEPRMAIMDDPFGALFGVGDGIRHRAGAQVGAGIDIPIGRLARRPLFLGIDLGATWFPDDRGPGWYVGGGLSLRINWSAKK